MTLRLMAPAKLNLFLRVLGRRPDGFHELETLFERIDLADELTFAERPESVTITCDVPTLDCGPGNLVAKAAMLLQDTCRIRRGAAIHLMKRIPIAAGLGGGSSDAATTLVGLNRLWRLGLSQARLQELGAQLGSDVPFFLEEQPVAVGRGRGERCEPLLGSLPILWHVLVCPPVQLSTKDVYDGFDRSTVFGPKGSVLTEPRSLITMCLHALRNGSLGELAKGLWNELEPEAIRRCPIIQEIHHHLRTSGCLGVMTSGSGPSVFGLCKDSSHAAQVTEYLQHQASGRWPVLATKTLASPPWDETLSVASDATTMESGGRSASTPRGAMA